MGRNLCVSAEALSAYLDGELTESTRALVEDHIRACERCSAELGALGRLDQVLAAPPSIKCATALPLLSARNDGELTQDETLLAESHLAQCKPCRAQVTAWSRIDIALAALPPVQPSARIDAAVFALVAPDSGRSRPGRPGFAGGAAIRAAVAVALVVAVAIAAIGQPRQLATQTETPIGAPQAVPLPPIARTQVLAAGAQQVLLNAKTNTLYVAHESEGAVGALNATTLSDVARIEVGGRPTALALNQAANTILVLDPSQKTITEIDGNNNTVLSTTALAVTGTPTSLQVDSANRRIVVAVTDSGASQTATSSGSVVVVDSASKKVESTRTVAVAARQVVLDPSGQRALLVSEDVVTIVDGSTYRPLDQLPGGVAAVFGARGKTTAVLSATSGGARLSIVGEQNAALTMIGGPVAIVALPQGGFAVLLEEDLNGRIVEIGADGTPGQSVSVALIGRELAYNGATRTYTVAGSGGVAIASIGGGVAVSVPGASGAPLPGNSAAATVKPSPSPSQTSVAAGSAVAARPNLPDLATLAWPGTYRLDLIGRDAPTVVGRGRGGNLWFVDSGNRLTSLNAVTGASYTISELPAGARIRSLLVGSSYVYAIDVASSRVYVVSLPSEVVTAIPLPFVKSSAAVTVTPDDRLWFAVSDQILWLDPRDGRIEAANVGPYNVSALTADSAGRVWFGDESRKRVGVYDRASGTVTDFSVPFAGKLSSMVVDSAGTLWAGTDAGELFAIRNGGLVTTTNVGRPVASLTLDSLGAAWFLAQGLGNATLGQVTFSAAARSVPASVSGVWFDARGDAWLADSGSAGFFIAVAEGR